MDDLYKQTSAAKLQPHAELAALKTLAASVSERVHSVVVLYGGTSGEREVSIASGKNVYETLAKEGFATKLIDTADTDALLMLHTDRPDVVFIALHGPGGEDGSMQGFLDTLNIPYTHSDAVGSALAIDKEVSKELYLQAGLKTASYYCMNRGSWVAESATSGNPFHMMRLPCVVKPLSDGSSLGVSIPKTREQFTQAVKSCFEISDRVMVEDFVEGVEVTVTVIGNQTEELIAFPVTEIIANSEFYDYEAKYAVGGSTHIIPARISASETEACVLAAKRAHEVLKCKGLSRTDIIVSADGTPWLIETNTVPGMTATSLVPEAAKHFGLTVGELYRLLLHYALERCGE